jgi:hypothetical protein
MVSATLIPEKSASSIIHSWWKNLAYRHKAAEFLMYFMFVTGLLLWDTLPVYWQIERFALLTHMLIGATLFSLIVGAFWSAHRKLITKSKNIFLKQTGSIIEWLLLTCTITGFYVFFWGNTGNNLSIFIENIHFYSSWILVPLMFRHAMRWSIINIKKYRS